jgi:hypothetical protein
MTGKVIDFRSRKERQSNPARLTHLQSKIVSLLDYIRNEIRHDKLNPDKVFLLIGTADDFVDVGQQPETTWRYLQLEFGEKELRAAMEQIYSDIRKQKR